MHEGCRLSVTIPPSTATVAIVNYRQGVPTPVNPTILFQVTIRSDKCSPSGAFIRFGDTPGDELVGWQRRDLLEVCEVLGEVQEDGRTVKAA